MKTRILLLVAIVALCLGSCDKNEKVGTVEGGSFSLADGNTECSYHDLTAGAHIMATQRNNTTNVEAVVYATSDIVNEVRVSDINNGADKVAELPYSESFIISNIRFNTKYEYVIAWGESPEVSSIQITYMVTSVDGKLSVDCRSFNN